MTPQTNINHHQRLHDTFEPNFIPVHISKNRQPSWLNMPKSLQHGSSRHIEF